jgi:hypothetical protein
MTPMEEIDTVLTAAHAAEMDVMGLVVSRRVSLELEEAAASAGSIVHVPIAAGPATVPVDRRVVGYAHPVTGNLLPIHVSDLPSRVIGVIVPEP